MSTISNALNNWLQRHYNVSVMGQPLLPVRVREVTACDAVPPQTRANMIEISTRSAMKRKEMGAAITHDYTLGMVMTGTRESVVFPRPEGTIGSYHTHPHGHPFPSITDALDAINKDDKIVCIGATGWPGTKIACFTPNKPKWLEIKAKFDELVKDIEEYNRKVRTRVHGTSAEIRLQVRTKYGELYQEGKALEARRAVLEETIRNQTREITYPKEWKTHKWVNGFKDAPFFEVYPNMFNKCRLVWEEIEEELPYEL